MSEQVNAAVESTQAKPKVSLKTLLTVYRDFWNESNGTATLNEVAEYLGMTVGNLRVRLYQARAELAKQGVKLEIMKVAKGPRKSRKRTDFDELADIVQDMVPAPAPEPAPEVTSEPETAEQTV